MGSTRIILLAAVLAGCGGKLAGSTEPSSFQDEDVSRDETAPAGPEDGEWGTWQLLWTGELGKRDYDPPFLELDLRSDGSAYLWQCASSVAPDGKRCPPAARTPCLEGKMSLVGTEWTVTFPGASGVVRDEPSGDIVVEGTGALPAKGHYWRVGAPSREGCVPDR